MVTFFTHIFKLFAKIKIFVFIAEVSRSPPYLPFIIVYVSLYPGLLS